MNWFQYVPLVFFLLLSILGVFSLFRRYPVAKSRRGDDAIQDAIDRWDVTSAHVAGKTWWNTRRRKG